jgi:hypothetical protein
MSYYAAHNLGWVNQWSMINDQHSFFMSHGETNCRSSWAPFVVETKIELKTFRPVSPTLCQLSYPARQIWFKKNWTQPPSCLNFTSRHICSEKQRKTQDHVRSSSLVSGCKNIWRNYGYCCCSRIVRTADIFWGKTDRERQTLKWRKCNSQNTDIYIGGNFNIPKRLSTR